MFKALNNLAPDYLIEIFKDREAPYNFRNNEKRLAIPKPRTDYMKRSFSYSGAALWNKLPRELRTATSLANFKSGLERCEF